MRELGMLIAGYIMVCLITIFNMSITLSGEKRKYLFPVTPEEVRDLSILKVVAMILLLPVVIIQFFQWWRPFKDYGRVK